jgi:hypothetical protein
MVAVFSSVNVNARQGAATPQTSAESRKSPDPP